MTREIRSRVAIRWLKFNTAGGIGIVLQLIVLAVLKTALHMNYLAATACAVELTVLHNYIWHEKFTWVDRASGTRFSRVLKFNITNGLISLVGNVVLMRLLVGSIGMQYLAANAITIGVCSIANFVISDRLVFKSNTQP
jgi:putative flippase GtrA